VVGYIRNRLLGNFIHCLENRSDAYFGKTKL